MVKHIRELWKGVKSLWGFRTQHYHNQNPHHLYHPNSVQRRGICWRYNGSLASLMVWCAEWERLITNNLKLANKCCAPPAASKMRSRLVIDFSLKGCDLVLRTACGVQNAFAVSDRFQPEGLRSSPAHRLWRPKRIRVLSNRPGISPFSQGKKNPPHLRCGGLFLAEREGFEPSKRYKRLHTFQACSFSHSDTSP